MEHLSFKSLTNKPPPGHITYPKKTQTWFSLFVIILWVTTVSF